MYPDYVSYLGNTDIDNTIIKFQKMNGTILTILKSKKKKQLKINMTMAVPVWILTENTEMQISTAGMHFF
jgi:hypothetical protein